MILEELVERLCLAAMHLQELRERLEGGLMMMKNAAYTSGFTAALQMKGA